MFFDMYELNYVREVYTLTYAHLLQKYQLGVIDVFLV